MRVPFVIAFLLLCACATPRVDSRHDGDRVQVTIDGELVRVTIDGEPFANVHHRAEPRPFVFPVLGLDGVPMTRSFPMAEVAGETKDHPHHVSLWFAHGDVNGFDFWAGKAHRERMEWDGRCYVASGETGSVCCGYRWLADDATVLCYEERELRFTRLGDDARAIDMIVTLRPARAPLVLGDTKEGTFAVRVQQGLRVDGSAGRAKLTNSEGQRDGEVWGKRARWIDDTATIDGREVGIALFDHPWNHGHPTWWHARTYGLLAANPFGVHDFEKKPAGTGTRMVPVNGRLRLQYRVLLHGPGWDRARLDQAYESWVAEVRSQSRAALELHRQPGIRMRRHLAGEAAPSTPRRRGGLRSVDGATP